MGSVFLWALCCNAAPAFVLSFFSSLCSDDVVVSVAGAHVHWPAVNQLHAAVGAVVHQGVVSVNTTLGPAA